MKYSLRKLTALLIAVLMLLSAFSSALADTEYSNKLEIGVSPLGSSKTSVDHIDVGCTGLTASVYINGERKTQTFSFGVNDVKNNKVDVTITSSGSFTQSSGVKDSTDNKGNPQVRFEGNFPVGTFENRQTYTVRLKKDLDFDGVIIPVVLTATYDYWTPSNVCPGLKGHTTEWKNGSVIRGSGIDLVLGSSSQYYGSIEINKKVAGLTLTQDTTYQFQVKDSNGKIVATPECVVSPKAVNPDGSYFGTCVADMVPYGTYTIVEVTPDDVEGYDLTTSTNKDNDQVTLSAENTPARIEVTNTYTAKAPTTTSIPVEKVWNDNDNQDNKRPTSVTVKLLADGKEVTDKTLILSEDNNWAGTFENLPLKNEGEDISYTVEEEDVDGYSSSVEKKDGVFVITNTHELEKTSITVKKEWEDNDDQDGKRPEEITVSLYEGEGEGKVFVKSQTVEPDEDGNWSYTFTDLPKYADGEEIVYTVDEERVAGYSSSVAKNEDGSYTITNTETTSISVTKDWNDNDNQDNKRPEKITVNLYAGEGDDKELKDYKAVTPDTDGNWSYTFTDLPKYADGEEIVYTVDEERVAGYSSSVAKNEDGSFTITNTETTSISVTKAWDDDNDRDKIRPDSVTVQLKIGENEVDGQTLVLNNDNKWTDSFTDLPKYDENENLIDYTVEETDVSKDYTPEITGSMAAGYTITNTHTPETTSITVRKEWDDSDDQDDIRPDSVTVQLFADGQLVEGNELTLSESNNWKDSFTNLTKYEKGVKINYSVEEKKTEDLTDYTAKVESSENGFVITNTYNPGKVNVQVRKVWNDNNNQDNIRPDSITINLLADDKPVASQDVTAEDGWTWTFENLDKNSQGKEIKYTINEDAVAGYSTEVTGSASTGFVITNTHTPEKTVVSGSKTWDDADNQDNKRPESITINLLADGKPVASKVVTAKDGWKWSFTNLPKYESGRRIVYTITEEAVEGYTAKVNGYDVTNSYDPEMIDEIAGSKTWNDSDNQDGKRPESITIRLYADGVEVASKVVTAEDGWAWSFTNLPKFNDGVEIVYTITEDAVEDYITSVEGFNVTNSHDPEMIDEIAGGKTWDDSDNQDGIRPESITINLLANGQPVATQVVTAESGWTWSFTNLPKYENGVEIVYTIAEEAVEGYIASTDGFNLTNIHVAETIDEIAGSKTWKDDNNSGKTRPESITIRLLADGNEVAAQVVTADDQWSWSFTNLPKYAAGKEIVYTIVEDSVKGYTAKVDGYNVTNTLDDEEVPKTGDARSDLQRTMLYLSMTFLMLGAACIAASMRKRKTNR